VNLADHLRALERFLLPNACISCRRLIGSATPDELLCGVCRSRLRAVPVGCDRCQQPLPPVGPCRFCAEWPSQLGWVRSAVWLTDEARDLVHGLKYRHFTRLADTAAGVLIREIRKPAGARLLPIPLGVKRLRERGYNQASLIAQRLGAAWACPVDESVLRRARETGSQTKLTPEERAANLTGAFRATPPPRRRSEQSAAAPPLVILVDDVLTTGATLVTAASTLARSGWSTIGAVTFARALTLETRVASAVGS